MARDKEMPGVLGLLHGRFATPHGGIWVLTGISALLGVYGVKSLDALYQITLASNTGTFLVYGMTCIITIIAFASRHDKHVIKHYAIPGIGALMNIGELFGVVYLAIKAGNIPGFNSATDAMIAIGAVIAWIVIGAVWVGLNPSMRGKKVLEERERIQVGIA